MLKKKILSSRTLRQIKIAIPYLKVIQEKQEKLNRATAHYSIQEYIHSSVYYANIPAYILCTCVAVCIHIYIIHNLGGKSCNSVHLQVFSFWNIQLKLGDFS